MTYLNLSYLLKSYSGIVASPGITSAFKDLALDTFVPSIKILCTYSSFPGFKAKPQVIILVALKDAQLFLNNQL